MAKNTKQFSYDELPYQSYPYNITSPESLATLGKFFGMNPPDIRSARVLELGCAEGGNIIPHAVFYPKSKYVGVDLSKVQIDEGMKHIKAMGLKNIELRNCSITDIDESFGKFDYIICHGVFSWVPDSVQDKILKIMNQNLTKNGIAYVSYNTLPGWNMVKTIRDMMVYHTKGIKSSVDKIKQANALLSFVKDSLKGDTSFYSRALSEELEKVLNKEDSYIRHEYLEDNNEQFYFKEFMAKAKKYDLQYLSDSSLASMYLGNMGSFVAKKLESIKDIVRAEQYLDFIKNRRFRCTLLCHNNVRINRSLSDDTVKDFAFSLDLTAEKSLTEVDLESKKPLKFYYQGYKDASITITSPLLKGIFYTFIENKGYPLKFSTVVNKTNEKYKSDKKDAIELELRNNAMNFVMSSYMKISLFEREYANLEKPSLTELAAYQLNNTNNKWLTSVHHYPVRVGVFDKFALKYMNGKNTRKDILGHLLEDTKTGKLILQKADKNLKDISQIKEELAINLDYTIENFSKQGVLK